MGLKIKSFQDVIKDMVDWVAQNTTKLIDFSEGSAIRTLLEAVAAEFAEFYFKMYKTAIWAVENSIFQSFNFPKREATKAYGTLRLSFNGPLDVDQVIPAGTMFSTVSSDSNQIVYFETTQDYTVPAGATYADITVYCTEPGTKGNVPSNSITQMINPVSFVVSVTNPERFNTGRDEETALERKQRFSKYIDSLHRGTKAALEYGTLEVPNVTGVYVDDSKTGIVYLYAHDGNGDLPDDLLKAVEANLENYRAAGIPVIVTPITKILLDVVVDVYVLPNYNNTTFKQYITAKIEEYLDSFVAGQNYQESDLNAFIRELDEVAIKNCIIKTPSQDQEIAVSQLIRSGNITVNLINAQ